MSPGIEAYNQIVTALARPSTKIGNIKSYIDSLANDVLLEYEKDITNSFVFQFAGEGPKMSYNFNFNNRRIVVGYTSLKENGNMIYIIAAVLKELPHKKKDLRIRNAAFLYDGNIQRIIKQENE